LDDVEAGHVKRTPALTRLEKRLTADPHAILMPAEVRLLHRETFRVLAAAVPGAEAFFRERGEDGIRWQAVGNRCSAARGARSIREVSVAVAIPQYRLRAIEQGLIREVRPDLARRYFRFLGIEDWVARWCRANADLAQRTGLVDPPARRSRPGGAIGRGK
jgi:hypothetical protein